jgi:hypothetical protein
MTTRKEILDLIRQEGLIEKDEKGRYQVTAKGLRRVEQSALTSLFQSFDRDAIGKHETPHKGAGSVVHEDSKAYEFGDNLSNLNLHETMRNAIVRQGRGTPVRLEQDDFVVYETEYQTSCATIVLIDMSGSMNRFGKYAMTKQVAMGLAAMVRAQYPSDTLRMVGFYSYASPLSERELLNSAPKPVSIYDSRVHLRIPLDQPPKTVPQHFTNIHAGLKLARNMLMREATAEQADHPDHRRRADGPHRWPRSHADLSSVAENGSGHVSRSETMRCRRNSRFELRADRGLLLFRAGEFRWRTGSRDSRRCWLLHRRAARSDGFREFHDRQKAASDPQDLMLYCCKFTFT